MNTQNSILLSKMNTSPQSVKDLTDDFGIVCTKIERMDGKEIQTIETQEWVDEDGEDAYIPNVLRLKAFDWTIECGTLGTSASVCKSNIDSLMSYLIGEDGKGAELYIYSAMINTGRQHVYFKQKEEKEYWVNAQGMTIAQFSITFRICDPRTDVEPNNDTTPTQLLVVI